MASERMLLQFIDCQHSTKKAQKLPPQIHGVKGKDTEMTQSEIMTSLRIYSSHKEEDIDDLAELLHLDIDKALDELVLDNDDTDFFKCQ